jgi:predicted metal-dependent peptidase
MDETLATRCRDRIAGPDRHRAAGMLARLMAAAPLYGARGGALELIVTDTLPDGSPNPTAATDSRRLYVNPEHFLALDEEAGLTVLAHEIAHAHDDHPARSGWRTDEAGAVTRGRDPLLWNMAADYSVNAKLVACGIATPKVIARLKGLYDARFPVEMSAEQIYYILESEQYAQQKKQQSSQQTPSQSPQDGAGQAGAPAPGEDTPDDDGEPQAGAEPQDDADGEPTEAGADGSDGEPEDGESEAGSGSLTDQEPQGAFGKLLPQPADADTDAAAQEHMLAEAISEAAGTLPDGMARALHSADTYTETDWRSLLARFADAAGRGNRDFSYRRINYRASGGQYRVLLPGYAGADPVRVLVALDMSGSVGAEEAARFVREVEEMLSTMPDIDADACTFDSRLYGPWPLRDLPQDLPGGGGTDVAPVFELADAEGYRAIVVLTDGYLNPPPEPTTPVLWCLSRPHADFSPGYGDVSPLFDFWRL